MTILEHAQTDYISEADLTNMTLETMLTIANGDTRPRVIGLSATQAKKIEKTPAKLYVQQAKMVIN